MVEECGVDVEGGVMYCISLESHTAESGIVLNSGADFNILSGLIEDFGILCQS